MTGKERMMLALRREKPDRLPVTIHQWMPYHLKHYMNDMDPVQAFAATGLDVAMTVGGGLCPIDDANWRYRIEETGPGAARHYAVTPKGELTWTTQATEYTVFKVEYPVKNHHDLELFLAYWPDMKLDQRPVAHWHERTGDLGIVRGFVAHYGQPGIWQDFCELVGTENAIMWAMDEPDVVHHALDVITRRKVDYVHREMPGAAYDLIEHGGGTASSSVISPDMFDTFCVPYDRRVIDALHEHGFPVVYHTCGGMMAILDRIPNNHTDASETLSPPGVGGDIGSAQRARVKDVLGARVALVGGIDQGNILTDGTPAQVEAEVRACFETFGAGGGYICSASDHFFDAPVENLKAMARAGAACRYA